MQLNRIRSRGHLPHWECEQGIYFVTFRLADSLPQSVIQEARQNLKRMSDEERHPSKQLERYLDRSAGKCYLREPAIAEIVANTVRHFNGSRYNLLAWCVMPNHVHVVFQALPNFSLDIIIHSWKSFSSREINHYLSRQGTLWQREYYDHLIRDGAQLQRAIRYTADNPSKSGLKNWPFVYVSSEVFGGTPNEDVSTSAW